MGDETQVTEGSQDTTDYKAMFEQLQGEKDALTNKVNELLGEAKKAKQSRREAEAAAQEEARKTAEAQGNYEQLFKSSEQQRESLSQELDGLKQTIAQEKVNIAAMNIASKLAEGENAELLSEFVGRRLRFVEDEIKVTDTNGNLTVSGLEDLAKEFEGSARYASLIKGRQSSGGGASGGAGQGSAPKTIPRNEFDALSQGERTKLLKEGIRPVNT